MNNTLTGFALTILALTVSLEAYAEVRSGPFSGQLDSADVSSMGTTTAMYRQLDQEPWKAHGPLPIEGEFTFDWPAQGAKHVHFDATIKLGTFAIDTHAKVSFFNIKSTQTYYDYTQQVQGKADWDAQTRTLTYIDRPDEDDDSRRDDGRESTFSESKKAECKEEKSKACQAFFKTSPELEGLVMELTFSEDLSTYKGKIVMVQFSGTGLEKASSDINLSIDGELSAQ